MKNNITNIIDKLRPFSAFFRTHRVALFIVAFLAIYSFLVIQINMLADREPAAAALAAKKQTAKRLTIDQVSIDRILRLEQENIEVKTLFQEARDNPFDE